MAAHRNGPTNRVLAALAALSLAGAAPHALRAQSTRSGSPLDPVFARIIASQPDYADSATRRLEVLTEIWGNVGLHHPVPSAAGLKWDDVLARAVAALDSLRTERDFADLLNRLVFAPLHDPLAYATTRSDNDSLVAYPAPLETRWLSPGTAYVSAVDRVYATLPGAAWELAPDFFRRLRAAIDSLAREHEIRRLVIDLRSANRRTFRPGVAGRWLGMWIERSVPMGQDVSVFRSTDADDLSEVGWLVWPRQTLAPTAPLISLPTVFLVNRTSYPAGERALDAIRTARPDVAIVFEASGPIPNLDYNGYQVWYPDSILLPHYRPPLLSADGSLGSVVDVTVPRALGLSELDTIADLALVARAAQPARAAFAFEDARITDDTTSTALLTREQRVAGLLKVWFWILHFDAYLEDASVDWRHLLPEWLPRVAAATDNRAYFNLLRRIGALLNDTHVRVGPPGSLGSLFTVPLALTYVEGGRVAVARVDTSESAIGVAPGDEVVGVNGVRISEALAEQHPYWSVSRPRHRTPLLFLMGQRDSVMTLRIGTAAGVREVTLPRSRPFVSVYRHLFPEHPAFAVLPGNLGYMRTNEFTSPQAFDSAMTALANTRGMILDNRSRFWGGAFNVARFVPTSPMVKLGHSIEAISYMHGGFEPTRAFGTARSSFAWWGSAAPQGLPYTKPVVVLIGEANISSGESIAQVLRYAHRAVFVGAPTNGTYGRAERIRIPGGAVFSFTVDRYLNPDGSKYHGQGIVPEVSAAPTLAGLRARRDEVYERAVQTLRTLVERSR